MHGASLPTTYGGQLAVLFDWELALLWLKRPRARAIGGHFTSRTWSQGPGAPNCLLWVGAPYAGQKPDLSTVAFDSRTRSSLLVLECG